jgi:molybdopterin-containing oxidoreductase family membrane subunit
MGLNKTVGLGISLTFWWVGIGLEHLFQQYFYFRQRWRMAINSAEAMTIFFCYSSRFVSIIHGSSLVAYWYCQFKSIWFIMGEFNSPLLWDICNFYLFSVSLVWWTGLLPDFAMLRDRAVTPFNKRVYSILSFGWSGRAKDWQRFEEVSLVLSWFSNPLYFLYTIVSMDFATSVIPGWHTLFSSIFRCWGCFSGFYGKYLLIIMRKYQI